MTKMDMDEHQDSYLKRTLTRLVRSVLFGYRPLRSWRIFIKHTISKDSVMLWIRFSWLWIMSMLTNLTTDDDSVPRRYLILKLSLMTVSVNKLIMFKYKMYIYCWWITYLRWTRDPFVFMLQFFDPVRIPKNSELCSHRLSGIVVR